jgi:hypothetical protein
MATPTIKEIQEAVDQMAALRDQELILDLGDTGPAVRSLGGTAVIIAENKQRLLTAVRREARSLRALKVSSTPESTLPDERPTFAIDPLLDYETPDVDVDTMKTWEEKAQTLDEIALLLETEKNWGADTLDLIAQELIRNGWAGTDGDGFFVAVKEG